MIRLFMCVPCCGVKPQRPSRRPTVSQYVLEQTDQIGLKLPNSDGKGIEKIQSGTIKPNSNDIINYKTFDVTRLADKNNDGQVVRVISTRYPDEPDESSAVSKNNNNAQNSPMVAANDDYLISRNQIASCSSPDKTSHIINEFNSQNSRSQPLESRAVITITSTSRIGDYARLEYSPVDDTESDGTNRNTGDEKSIGSKPNVNDLMADHRHEPISRLSSPGIESRSISIASQLSKDYLDQNLTNTLDSVQILPGPICDSIGLPLAPLYPDSEHGKTSPETTGAALTTGDESPSRSSPSYNEASQKISDKESSGKSSVGAAVVGVESSGKHNESDAPKKQSSGLFSVFPKRSKKSAKDTQLSSSNLNDARSSLSTSLERPGSSISTQAGTSANNPSGLGSPTPSNMSKSSLKGLVKTIAKDLGFYRNKKSTKAKQNKSKENKTDKNDGDDTSSESDNKSDKPSK